MGILAALGSALFVGTANFLGGWSSRRISPLVTTLWINVVAVAVLAPTCATREPRLFTANALAAERLLAKTYESVPNRFD